MTADALNAELHVECWSGKGVVRNYGDKKQESDLPMPKYVPLALANDFAALWNFSNYVPDTIVINLGSKCHCTSNGLIGFNSE